MTPLPRLPLSSGVGTVEDLTVVSLLGRSGLKARRASGVQRRWMRPMPVHRSYDGATVCVNCTRDWHVSIRASKGKTGAVIGVLERERDRPAADFRSVGDFAVGRSSSFVDQRGGRRCDVRGVNAGGGQ
jgi:hypothetical protein